MSPLAGRAFSPFLGCTPEGRRSPLYRDMVHPFRPLPVEVGRRARPPVLNAGMAAVLYCDSSRGSLTPPAPFPHLVHRRRVALRHVKVAMLAGPGGGCTRPFFILRGSLRGTIDSEGLRPSC